MEGKAVMGKQSFFLCLLLISLLIFNSSALAAAEEKIELNDQSINLENDEQIMELKEEIEKKREIEKIEVFHSLFVGLSGAIAVWGVCNHIYWLFGISIIAGGMYEAIYRKGVKKVLNFLNNYYVYLGAAFISFILFIHGLWLLSAIVLIVLFLFPLFFAHAFFFPVHFSELLTAQPVFQKLTS